MLFKRGKLVFTEDLEEQTSTSSGVPYFTAKALVITEADGQNYGSVEVLKISDLIQKTSSYVYDGVNKREAHKLYSWPANLGDHHAWAESKRIFLMQHVMNFPIHIISVDGENQITWEFITPEQFKIMPQNLQASPDFQKYLDHQDEWFFLRKERNEPF